MKKITNTQTRLIDLRNLMLNFPEDAKLEMSQWTPYRYYLNVECGTACCAAGNAVIYLKSWSDHLEFRDKMITYITAKLSINSTITLSHFLPDLNSDEFNSIFIYPDTTEEVAAAITRFLED